MPILTHNRTQCSHRLHHYSSGWLSRTGKRGLLALVFLGLCVCVCLNCSCLGDPTLQLSKILYSHSGLYDPLIKWYNQGLCLLSPTLVYTQQRASRACTALPWSQSPKPCLTSDVASLFLMLSLASQNSRQMTKGFL